jgi:thiol-disulfide isomerase/thioredoxin
MEFLNIKIFNKSIKIWIFILISILFLIFLINFNKNEKYSEKINKNVIYNFNTTWCKYSRDFQPIWDQFEKENNLDIDIKDVKCDDESLELCNKYPVRGFPTVLLDINGKVKIFNGERSVEALNQFVKENQ